MEAVIPIALVKPCLPVLILTGFVSSAWGQVNAGAPTAADPVGAPAASANPPLTLSSRYRWVAWSSIGAPRLAGYAITSGWSTGTNSPEEYGTHWDGFGKRFGMRVATGATGNLMEASLGALWGEDPRYDRAAGQPFKKRVIHIAKMTFLARDRNGAIMPAYARYMSVPANSYLTNAWRADSEGTAREAAIRIPWSFVTRAAGNSFTEFWPDVKKWLHH